MKKHHLTLLFAALLLFACGSETAPFEPAADAFGRCDLVTLELETRSGLAARGWSLERGEIVAAEEADLVLSSFDCGARGRWVSLEAVDVELCVLDASTDTCAASSAIEIGGSDPDVELGDELGILRDGVVVATIVLVARTETPSDWVERADEPFVVTLDVRALAMIPR